MSPNDLPDRDPGLPRFLVLAAVLAALGVAGMSARGLAPGFASPDAPPAGSADELDGASGASLFVSEGCGTCHVTVGPSTALNPSLSGMRRRAEERLEAAEYSGRATSPEEYVAEALLDHCADVLDGYSCEGAPDVGVRLGEKDVRALVDFLLRLE